MAMPEQHERPPRPATPPAAGAEPAGAALPLRPPPARRPAATAPASAAMTARPTLPVRPPALVASGPLPGPPPLPASPWPAGRPTAPASTRPAELPTPRPGDFQPTRPADFQPTRPADALPPRPADGQPGRVAGLPLGRPPAPPPAPAPGAWQLAGARGQHLVLMPGQMHLGRQAASLRTLLGSCVAITLWHPGLRIGGMCHYLLPARQRRAGEAPDGRYGDEAVEAMVQRLRALGAEPADFVAHLYGGADTLASANGGLRFNIGERNIEQGWTLIDRYGFQLEGVDVGEDVPRVVSLSMADGAVQMRRGNGRAPQHLRG